MDVQVTKLLIRYHRIYNLLESIIGKGVAVRALLLCQRKILFQETSNIEL